ncbi:MAG: hypothetical protein OXB88_06825 [Bacteriovoracales bacterium]|nr:hypothetical protein [Bacteriovoracales bacterium]
MIRQLRSLTTTLALTTMGAAFAGNISLKNGGSYTTDDGMKITCEEGRAVHETVQQ